MCGIAGIFNVKENTDIDKALLKRMSDIQSHRGPDADGFFFDKGLGLAHRRLSIIDLEGSPQPMTSACGRAVIVFNGEIYNFKELHQELAEKGYQFNTDGDTETILNAYLEWGEKCVDKLRGMFAFTIWDEGKQQLFMARDRLGIKPFFYSLLPSGEFIFGSELKVLKKHPQCPRELNKHAIEDYFTLGYIPEPKTIFDHVYKLEPGYFLTLKKGDQNIKPQQYWDISFDQQSLSGDNESTLLEKIKEAVKIRMVAEVPLGAFLSGGVDSSGVVAMMAQLSDKPVNTCSIGFDVKSFNETEYAQDVANKYQTNHVCQEVSSDDFDLIDKLADLYDEPYADSSAMPTYRVCELARKNVTVALSGDGGDELMAGYRRYKRHLQEEKFRSIIPLAIRKPIFGLLGRIYPKLDWAPRFLRAKTTFQSMSYDWVEGYLNSMSILRKDEREKLFSDDFKQQLGSYNAINVFRRHANNASKTNALSQVQYVDMKTYLVGDILTKVDRASMAHSLEVRVPLLDHHFVEWVVNINNEERINDKGQGKSLFKKALEPHLPHDILYRKKMGFGVPLAKWFRGPLKEKIEQSILSPLMLDSGIFEAKTLSWLVSSHMNGQRDNSASLWTLLMFERFLHKEMQ